MKKLDYTIDGMTMAITNMEAMLDFYSNVFGISFREKAMYDSKLYSGNWGGMKLLFCPAEIAGNTAKQNRHQFDIVTEDIKALIESVVKYGGKTIGPISEDSKSISIGVYDPDKNSVLFKQLK